MEDDYTEADVAEQVGLAPDVVRALKKLGIEHEPPIGWETRAFAAFDAMIVRQQRDLRTARRDWIMGIALHALRGLAVAFIVGVIVAYLAGWL